MRNILLYNEDIFFYIKIIINTISEISQQQILRSYLLDNANVNSVFTFYEETNSCEFFEIVNLISRAHNENIFSI